MDTTLIKMVISTLNDIEVKGKDNLDHLLGCINALEGYVKIVENQSEPTKEEEINGG